ncbi:MAG: S8 family serine peptidase [Ignavibacteriaceae bacterium]|nr:S8 family serine peptidase [Ignavibacteriaceae bacterium]
MKKILMLVCLSFFVCYGQAPLEKTSVILKNRLSSLPNDSKVLVWIFFKDKGNVLNKSYQVPGNIVSEASLKRREKVLDKSNLIDFTDIPVFQEYISKLQSEGFELNQKSKWLNGVSGYITKQDLDKVLGLPFVEKADIVHQFKKRVETINQKIEINKSIPNYKPSGVNSLDYGPSFPQVNQINVPALHSMGYKGQGVTICVMDAGVSLLNHEAFDSLNIIATYDFVNHRTYIGDGLGGHGVGDHGTMTLSLIGGNKPGQIIGPAYKSNFILAKTENTDSESPIEEDNWIAAMEWADSIGVEVTSTSLGYLTFDDTVAVQFDYTWQNMDGRTTIITKGAVLAARKGICVVNAAGNEGDDPTHNTLDAPADADSIITAGAVDIAGIRADFSSVGNTVDGRIKPDVMALGQGDYVAVQDNTTSYGYGNGTSFSCPLTAGVCAQLLSFDHKLTPIQIREALRNTASQSTNPDRHMGWGIINALSALNYIHAQGVNNDRPINPDNFILYQNYPNPFNPTTQIKYFVPYGSIVSIDIYNVLGMRIFTLFNGFATAGDHELTLNATKFSSGIYFVKLSANAYQKTIKITLLK